MMHRSHTSRFSYLSLPSLMSYRTYVFNTELFLSEFKLIRCTLCESMAEESSENNKPTGKTSQTNSAVKHKFTPTKLLSLNHLLCIYRTGCGANHIVWYK